MFLTSSGVISFILVSFVNLNNMLDIKLGVKQNKKNYNKNMANTKCIA